MAGGGDDIQTNWTADFSDVNDAFESTSKAASAGLEQVAASAQEAAEHVSAHSKEMSEGFEGIGESIKTIKGQLQEFAEFTGLAALYEGFEKLKEVIESTTAKGVEIANMAQVLGITTDQFQALSATAAETGVSMTQVERSGSRLNLLLEQARQGAGNATDKLHQLGITNAEISNTSFSLIDALGQIHEHLENTATSAQTTTALTEVFGVRAALVAQVLREFDGSLEGVNKKLDDTNALAVGQVKDLQQLHAEYATFEEKVSNTWEKIALAAVHAATEVKNYAGAVIWATGQVPNALASLHNDPTGDIGARQDQVAEINAEINKAQTEQQAQVAASVATQLAGVEEVSQEQMATIKIEMELAKQAMESDKANSEQKLKDASDYTELVGEYYRKDSENYRTALAQKEQLNRAFHDAVDNFAQQSQEYDDGLASRFYSTHSAALDKLRALNEEEHALEVKEAESAATLTENAALAGIAGQEDALKSAYSDKTISAQADYTGEVQLAAQKLAIQMTYYANLRKLYENDAEKQREILGKEAAAQQAYALTVQRSQEQLITHLKQEWAGVSSAFSNSLGQALTGMLEGTTTFASAMQSIFSSMVGALIQHFVDWGVAQLEQLILVKVATGVTASAQVASNAAVAATAAMASVAAIPFYGWAMAPEVGAETYGIAMGYESVASAAGGWANVDADQMAQVHKNEMVLPAKFNQGMTNLVNSFASGGQNDSGGGKSSKGFTLQAMPVSDDHMLVRQGDLVALIQKANDRFQFGGRR